jgi:hypothetical protein
MRTYDGISVFETLAQAREAANRFRALGNYVAEVAVSEEAAIRAERTFLHQPGHHTLWGDPDEMLNSVIRVLPLTEQES